MAQRLSRINHIWQSYATLIPSSEDPGLPVEGLLDQLRQNFWRTALGWTIVAGMNDRIDFNRGGVKVATINPGTYATAALLCAAIIAALEAADAPPVWNCTYSAVTHIFTISSDTAFVLLFGTGANKPQSIALDIGFPESDTSSGTSFSGLNQSHQSRHFLVVDFGTSIKVHTLIALAEHNIGLTGPINVRVQFNSTNTWLAPTHDFDISASITTDGKPTRVYITDPNKRYMRLVVVDTYNPDGFLELGMLWTSGDFLEISERLERTVIDNPQDFTRFEEGPDGTLYVDFGRHRDRLTLVWRPLHGADLTNLRAFLDALKVAQNWLLDLDSTTSPQTLVYYGHFLARPVDSGITHEVAVIVFEFVVAL